MSDSVFTPAQEARIIELIRELLAEPSGHTRRSGAGVKTQNLPTSLTDEGDLESERASRLVEPPVVTDKR